VDLSGPGGPSRLKAAMTPRTKLVMCESPTNPMMRICDLRALAATTHATTPGASCFKCCFLMNCFIFIFWCAFGECTEL